MDRVGAPILAKLGCGRLVCCSVGLVVRSRWLGPQENTQTWTRLEDGPDCDMCVRSIAATVHTVIGFLQAVRASLKKYSAGKLGLRLPRDIESSTFIDGVVIRAKESALYPANLVPIEERGKRPSCRSATPADYRPIRR